MACRQARPHLGRHEGYVREAPQLLNDIQAAARLRCVRQEGNCEAAQCVPQARKSNLFSRPSLQNTAQP